MAVGGDRAYLVSDRLLAGSDTLATSYVLSRAIRTIEEKEGRFDLIFCGQQAVDGETGQVGPELAEYLDYPQVTNALDVSVDDGAARVKRQTEHGFEILSVPLPCLITVTKPDFNPRHPTLRKKLEANRADIPTMRAADISLDLDLVGLSGSPTRVKRSYVPKPKKSGIIIKGTNVQDVSKRLVQALNSAGVLK